MDKAELTAAADEKPVAEGAQLLAAVMSVPRQNNTDLDDAQMVRLSHQPLSLISFLAARRRTGTELQNTIPISPQLVFGVRRPDLSEPPRSPRTRGGVPAAVHQKRAVPVSLRAPVFAFEPTENDRDEAVEHASPASPCGTEMSRAWPWLAFSFGVAVLGGMLLLAVLG